MRQDHFFTNIASDSEFKDAFTVYIDVYLLTVLQTTNNSIMVPCISAPEYLLTASSAAVALLLSK